MKKVIFGLVALFASSVALADGYSGASSSSLSGTHASTSAIGGGYSANGIGEAVTDAPGWGAGYSYQRSAAGATNTTSAGALSNSNGSTVELGAGVSSEGSTYSYSDGIQGGAGFGTTSGFSLQYGSGEADAGGYADAFELNDAGFSESWGDASVNSSAGQLSLSITSNTNNGSSGAVSHGFAYSSNVARLQVDAGDGVASAIHDVDSEAEAGGYGATRSDGAFAFAIGGGSAEGSASTWADTETYSDGGDYDQCVTNCGTPDETKGNNGFGNGPDGHPPGHFKNGGGAHRGQDDPTS